MSRLYYDIIGSARDKLSALRWCSAAAVARRSSIRPSILSSSHPPILYNRRNPWPPAHVLAWPFIPYFWRQAAASRHRLRAAGVITMIEFLIGVDGGGSGTRVRLARVDHLHAAPIRQGSAHAGSASAHAPLPACTELSAGAAGPSGLSLGIASAWAAVEAAIDDAFAGAALARPARAAIAVGLGLAGVHNPQWAAAFAAADPGYAQLALASDACTTVLGAHDGAPGAIIALGTGSVGEVRLADGRHREVGGWGFPAGDEAGGAWIGLQAINHLQQSVDGRLPPNAFAHAVAQALALPAAAPRGVGEDGGDVDTSGSSEIGGAGSAGARAAIQQWLAGANQTRYAQLAPVVLRHADSDSAAQAILCAAGVQIARMAAALDASGTLPIALCGGLAAPLRPYLPAALQARLTPARGDSAAGALRLIRERLQHSPA